MPEGDTIHRLARRLSVLQDQLIVRARSNVADFSSADFIGRRVTTVRALGKNLLIELDDRKTLLSHMRMHGYWHIRRVNEPGRRPESYAKLVLQTQIWAAACFDAPVLELLTPWQLEHHPQLVRLGPDLLDEGFDSQQEFARFRSRPELAIAEALLLQRIVAGVGNVFKSEILFLCGVSPFTKVAALSDPELARITATAQKLLARNVGPGPRTTAFWSQSGQRYWVYRRAGRPCIKCGSIIQSARQGLGARTTYWCPVCQPPALGDDSVTSP